MKNRTEVSHQTKVVFILLTIFSFLVCSLAFADGDSRVATTAEKEFNKVILNAFAKAVPPGPEGWEKTGDSTEISELKVVYTAEKQPLRIEYHIVWQDTKRMREAQELLNQELMKLVKKPGVTGEDVTELEKKMAPHDVKVRIDISANLSSVGINQKISSAPAIADGLAFRSQGEYRSEWIEGSTYVFLGKNWKMNTNAGTYVDFTPVTKAIFSTAVQNICVKVQADPKRAEQLIPKIDWEALKKMIK